MSNEGIRLELTHDEALVLFEFLARYEETGCLDFVDEAEHKPLSRLQAGLERRLVEMFLPNYDRLVQEARDRLRDPVE